MEKIKVRKKGKSRIVGRITGRILILVVFCIIIKGIKLPDLSGISGFILKTGLNMSWLGDDKTDTVPDTDTRRDVVDTGEESDRSGETANISYEEKGNIRETTITGKGSSRYYESSGIYINNKTEYEVFADTDRKISLSGDGPQVLVIHTHGSEAYALSSGFSDWASS